MSDIGKILVTGGCGYIGSHTCVELLEAGYEVAVVDNLINGYIETLDKVTEITGKPISFFEMDVRDEKSLTRLMQQQKFFAVVHFAGLKSPTESLQKPLDYFDNNVSGTLSLLRAMKTAGVKRMIFSSTAAVYGIPDSVPVDETAPVGNTINPYAASKLIIEDVLKSYQQAEPSFVSVVLRYFNPVGAHKSGLIGENPKGIPNNLMPHICRVATGKQRKLMVFGNDYETVDGTGVRDFIHIMDLAAGHVSALKYLSNGGHSEIFNLGTGVGYSVLDLVKNFESVSGIEIPLEFALRRNGDVASCYASVELARRKLKWTAQYDLEQMCADTWRWQQNNI